MVEHIVLCTGEIWWQYLELWWNTGVCIQLFSLLLLNIGGICSYTEHLIMWKCAQHAGQCTVVLYFLYIVYLFVLYTPMVKLKCICLGLKEANAVAWGTLSLSTQPGLGSANQCTWIQRMCSPLPYRATDSSISILGCAMQCCGTLSAWNKTKYSQLVTDSLSSPPPP